MDAPSFSFAKENIEFIILIRRRTLINARLEVDRTEARVSALCELMANCGNYIFLETWEQSSLFCVWRYVFWNGEANVKHTFFSVKNETDFVRTSEQRCQRDAEDCCQMESCCALCFGSSLWGEDWAQSAERSDSKRFFEQITPLLFPPTFSERNSLT